MANPESFRQFTLSGVAVTTNEFGHGSYAVVLELKYRGLKCAGKKLYRVLYEAGIGHAARRYLEECQLLSQTRHPNIVQFIGVVFEEDSQFPILVMEFLPANLFICLNRYGVLPEEISYSILHDVSLGLAYLHGQTPTIMHRDLSANNILLSSNMRAKISDLGVARILNLTPLQVSQMTGTPGTPAYMPPEVMVADPHYDTSLDMFSFGVMIIHTLTAEWPLPKVTPTRVDPNNPGAVIGVTEVERREEFLRKIARDHPLMDLIMMCLSNSPDQRPQAEEVVGRMGDMVLQYPPSFENRVEMLRRINTLDTEKRDLEREIVKKDSTICEKTEKLKQLKEKSENTIEHIKLVSSVEAQQNEAKIVELKGQIEDHLILEEDLRAWNQELTDDIQTKIANLGFLQNKMAIKHSREATLTSQVASLTAQVSALKTTLAAQVTALSCQLDEEKKMKKLALSAKKTIIASKEADIAAKDRLLQRKESTIHSLNQQLKEIQNYLTHKEQPLQAELSYSQCSDAPVEMSRGMAIVINGKVYYGGGACLQNQCSTYCYSLAEDEWSSLPKLPVYRFGLGKVKEHLVAVGGTKELNLTATNEVHMLVKGKTWKNSIPSMPTARHSSSVVSLPAHLLVAGGSLATYQFTDIVEIYDINNSQWTKTDKLPYACSNPRVAVCNNTVYVLGGWDGNNLIITQADKLISKSVPVDQQEDESTTDDSDHDSAWKEITTIPSYRPSPVAVADMVLTIGGAGSSKRLSYTEGVYAYSSSMDSCVYISDLPSPRTHTATVSLSPTEFLIIGGENEDTSKVKTVYKATFSVVLK